MSFDPILSFFSSINWINPTWDIFGAILFAAVCLFVLAFGRDRISIALFAMYAALAVVLYVPFIREFQVQTASDETFLFKVLVFFGLFLLLVFLLSQSAMIRSFSLMHGHGKLWQIIPLAFCTTGLLFSVCLSFIPQENLGWLSGLMHVVFLSDAAKTAWMIAPLVILAFFGRAGNAPE